MTVLDLRFQFCVLILGESEKKISSIKASRCCHKWKKSISPKRPKIMFFKINWEQFNDIFRVWDQNSKLARALMRLVLWKLINIWSIFKVQDAWQWLISSNFILFNDPTLFNDPPRVWISCCYISKFYLMGAH